ncbi:MAG: LuxR C-terminal-related transcriptional regulator [Pyrinomonadaceae bacterium]
MHKSANHHLAAIHESEASCAGGRNGSLTIIVADDHELIRKSVAALLSYESDFRVLESAHARQLCKLVERRRPEVVIVDVTFGGVDAIETTKRIKALSPATRVIVVSAYLDELFVRSLLEAGIGGYVLKSDPARDLIEAIRCGEGSQVHLSPKVAGLLKRDEASSAEAYSVTNAGSVLSPRQREVLCLIAQGYSSKKIAATFGISESTVKSHRKSIMEKLGIHDRVGLTRHAIRIGLTQAE